MGSMEGKLVPEQYREQLLLLAQDEHSFNATYHNVDRFTWTVERAKELGVYEFLLSRSPRFWGTAEDIRKRLIEFRAMGLTQWQFYIGMAGLDRLHVAVAHVVSQDNDDIGRWCGRQGPGHQRRLCDQQRGDERGDRGETAHEVVPVMNCQDCRALSEMSLRHQAPSQRMHLTAWSARCLADLCLS